MAESSNYDYLFKVCHSLSWCSGRLDAGQAVMTDGCAAYTLKSWIRMALWETK